MKGLAGYFLWSAKPLPVDLRNPIFELAQNRGQIFGVLEGALYAHEIRFAKTQKLDLFFYGPTFGGHYYSFQWYKKQRFFW